MRKKYFILPLCCLLCAFSAFGQPFPLKHLGVEDGLSNNYVLDIAQDKKGLIWIATESGLNRFDGKNFTVYKENNSKLVNDAVNTLLYDSAENMLWVGTRNGLCLFNCSSGQFEDFSPSNGMAGNNVVYFSHASDGGIWITCRNAGISHYDKKTKKQDTLLQGDGDKLRISRWGAPATTETAGSLWGMPTTD
jgi:ligand-binding sensor domain-containing protein